MLESSSSSSRIARSLDFSIIGARPHDVLAHAQSAMRAPVEMLSLRCRPMALVVPRALARRTPLTTAAFDRWIALFHSTVDDLFSGPMAAHAKNSASRIAATMERNFGSMPSSIDASFLRDHKVLVAAADHNQLEAIE